jgi:hypothetical protein
LLFVELFFKKPEINATPNIKLGAYGGGVVCEAQGPTFIVGLNGNDYATTDWIYADVDDVRKLAAGR